MMLEFLSAIFDPAVVELTGDRVVTVLVALFGGGGIVALLNYRKTNAESKDISVKTMTEVIQQLREEIRWRDSVIESRGEVIDRQGVLIGELRERVATLEERDRVRGLAE
jgi:hypothetical protein